MENIKLQGDLSLQAQWGITIVPGETTSAIHYQKLLVDDEPGTQQDKTIEIDGLRTIGLNTELTDKLRSLITGFVTELIQQNEIELGDAPEPQPQVPAQEK